MSHFLNEAAQPRTTEKNNIITVEPQLSTDCPICAYLTSSFEKDNHQPFELEWLLLPRYGYLYGDYDLLFRPQETQFLESVVATLGLRQARRSGGYDGHTHMVDFVPNIPPYTGSDSSMLQLQKVVRKVH
ncbi:hypothetical protein LTR56_023562 [Elasticomyces elasticus]|nr:hypothetical protein LTR56_023562 [Elasticomyces elasticus]KAK3624230.1 hypothetical protein LTR22_024058 [Elasticomyces elasticus]KAK4906088.1 hypothetical protein LTR49_024716 [Elasticomyces elasticus]KAK5744108.1 hypothetical protein LTS12_023584 [Elasticomyces elasticus]